MGAFDRYPYTNFHELNLEYFIQHFNEIFTEWEELYTTLTEWQSTTTAELEAWKTEVLTDIDERETALRAELSVWKTETEAEISDFEAATLSALDDWKDSFQTLFEETFTNLLSIKTDAEAARDAAALSATAAAGSATDAASSAASVAASAAQIAENAADISVLETKTDDLQTRVIDWYNVTGSAALSASEAGSTISRTDLITVDIAAGQPYSVLLTDPDDCIATNTSGLKVVTLYYSDSGGSYHQIGSYTVGVEQKRIAPEAITRLAFYKASGATGNAGTVTAAVRYRTVDSDYSDEYNLGLQGASIEDLETGLTDIAEKSVNLFDEEHFTTGYYRNKSGNIQTNASYGYTDWIPVSPADVIYYNTGNAKCICATDRFGIAVPNAGIDSGNEASGTYTVPAGIAFISISFLLADVGETPVISIGELEDYTPFDSWKIKASALPSELVSAIGDILDDIDDAQDDISELEKSDSIAMSHVGSETIRATADTLSADTNIDIDDAPWFLKMEETVSFYAKFSLFDKIYVGKGWGSYRGNYFEIDNTNITVHKYFPAGGQTPEHDYTDTPVAHGLTISDYIQVVWYRDTGGMIRLTINTLSGSYHGSFNVGYYSCGAPFGRSTEDLTDVVLHYSGAALRHPVWVLGDSYMSSGNTRILGQFLLAGFANNCYSAIDGGRTTPNDYKDMTAELERMLQLATPKIIVWALGMNDSYAHNHDAIEQVMSTCAMKGITLILYKTPSTPSYDRSDLNAYVISTGLRYVDAFEAVGVHGEDNEWYEGFLDVEETPYAHPTTLGAAAIAARYLIDVPELTQYGYTSS